MLPPFGRLALLPAVKHDGDRMVFPMPIGGQIMQQHLAGRFKASGKGSGTSQHVIPIDDQMRWHISRYRGREPTVNPNSAWRTGVILDKAADI